MDTEVESSPTYRLGFPINKTFPKGDIRHVAYETILRGSGGTGTDEYHGIPLHLLNVRTELTRWYLDHVRSLMSCSEMETVTSTAIGFGWPHDEERILHGKLIESTDHPHLHLRIGTEQNYLDWQKSDASCTVVVTWPGWKLTWWVVENGGIEPEEQDEDVLEAQDVEGEGAEGAEGADETDEEEDEEDDENDQNDGDGDDETEDDGPPGHVSHQTQYLEGDAFRLIYKEYAGYRGVTLLGIHPTQTVQEVVLWGDRCRLPDGSFKLRLQALRQPPYVRDLSNLDEPVDLTKEPYIPTDE